MPKKPRPTAERVRELLDYDPETGVLRWRSTNSAHDAGDVAGCDQDGYVQICIGDDPYGAHRLAWVHYYGVWPTLHIDHIDRCRNNNAITNLREVTVAQNQQNRTGLTSRSTSGFPGVSKRNNRWRAGIQVDRRSIHIGYYATAQEAAEAYRAAKRHYHPFSQ